MFFKVDGIIIMKADNGNDSNSVSSETSTIWRSLHSWNALEYIIETFDRIKIELMFDYKNEYESIVCKLEFVSNWTFVRLLQ